MPTSQDSPNFCSARRYLKLDVLFFSVHNGDAQPRWDCTNFHGFAAAPKKHRGGQAKRVSRGSVLDPFCVAPLVCHTKNK